MSDDIIARLYCSYADPPCEVCTFCAARAEINRLRRFRAEAMAVLDRWQAVADLVPTERRSLGEYWADIVAAEIKRLHAVGDALHDAVMNHDVALWDERLAEWRAVRGE